MSLQICRPFFQDKGPECILRWGSYEGQEVDTQLFCELSSYFFWTWRQQGLTHQRWKQQHFWFRKQHQNRDSTYPIGSMYAIYAIYATKMLTFTINIPHSCEHIYIYIHHTWILWVWIINISTGSRGYASKCQPCHSALRTNLRISADLSGSDLSGAATEVASFLKRSANGQIFGIIMRTSNILYIHIITYSVMPIYIHEYVWLCMSHMCVFKYIYIYRHICNIWTQSIRFMCVCIYIYT